MLAFMLRAMYGFLEKGAKVVESAMEPTSKAQPGSQARRRQMPLAFLRAGESASVLKVRGSGDARHHLENLGFVPGASIRVVSEQGGNVLVEVKGSQVGLDRSAASKIVMA